MKDNRDGMEHFRLGSRFRDCYVPRQQRTGLFPMKMRFINDWLRRRIEIDPDDVECGTPPEANGPCVTELRKRVQFGQGLTNRSGYDAIIEFARAALGTNDEGQS